MLNLLLFFLGFLKENLYLIQKFAEDRRDLSPALFHNLGAREMHICGFMMSVSTSRMNFLA